MFAKSLIIAVVVLVYHNSLSTAQLFGGVSSFPGGQTNQFGYQAGPAWGSLAQTHTLQGSSPITYSGGLNAINRQGSGVSGSLAVQPGIGGLGTVRGQAGLLNSGNHHVNAFVQHDRSLSRDLSPVGPATNSAGVNYLNKNGASAFVQGSQTSGLPARGTVGGSVPLYTNRNIGISATGQATFGPGMKPDPQVGVQGVIRF